MFIDLGNRVSLTDEQFQAEMAKRVAAASRPGHRSVGCPLCNVVAKEEMKTEQTTSQQQQQQQQQQQ